MMFLCYECGELENWEDGVCLQSESSIGGVASGIISNQRFICLDCWGKREKKKKLEKESLSKH